MVILTALLQNNAAKALLWSHVWSNWIYLELSNLQSVTTLILAVLYYIALDWDCIIHTYTQTDIFIHAYNIYSHYQHHNHFGIFSLAKWCNGGSQKLKPGYFVKIFDTINKICVWFYSRKVSEVNPAHFAATRPAPPGLILHRMLPYDVFEEYAVFCSLMLKQVFNDQ